MSFGNLTKISKFMDDTSIKLPEKKSPDLTHEDVVHNTVTAGVGEYKGTDLIDARAVNDPNINTSPMDEAKIKTIQAVAGAMRKDKILKKEVIQRADDLLKGGVATKDEVEQIQKDLGDDKHLADIEKDGTAGGTLLGNLKDALTYLSPRLIAMSVAGGNARAMTAAYQLGGQAQKSINDYISTRNKDDMSTYQKASLDLRGKELKHRKITEGRLTKEQGNRESRFTKDHNRKIRKEMALSDKQLETVTNLNVALDISNRMTELVDKNYLGPFASRLQSFVEPFGFAPTTFTQLKVNVIDALAKYTKAQTGAQATDNERAWLAQTMPGMNMSNEVFKDKNKEFQRRLKMIIHRNLTMAHKWQGKIPIEWELDDATSASKTAGPQISKPEKFKNLTEDQERELYLKMKAKQKSKQR